MFDRVPTIVTISVLGFVVSIAALAASPLTDLPFPCLAGIWFNVPLLFWLGFSLVMISIYWTFFETTRLSEPPRWGFRTNLPVVLFFLIFFLSPVIREPNPRSPDVWQFLLYTQTLSEHGRIGSLYGLTVTEHEYWPGLFIVGSIFSQVSGAGTILASRALSIIFPVIMLVAVYLALQRIVAQKRLLVYGLLFYTIFFFPISSPIYSPQYFCLVFYPLLVYLWSTSGSRARWVCSLLFSTAIIVSHPVSSLIILAMALSICILSLLPPNKARFGFNLGAIFFLISFLAWGFLSAAGGSLNYVNNIVDYLRRVYEFGIYSAIETPSMGLAFGVYPIVELYYTRVTRYVPLLLSFLALYTMAKAGDYRRLKFLLALMFGSFCTLPIWVGALGWAFWDRTLFFAALPVSALAASHFCRREAALHRVEKRHCGHWPRRLALVVLIVFLVLLPFKFMQYDDESTRLYKDSEVAASSFLGRSDPGGSLLLTDASFWQISKFFDPRVVIDFGPDRLFFSDKYVIDPAAGYVAFTEKAQAMTAIARGEEFSFPRAQAELSAVPTYNLVANFGTSVIFARLYSG
jgi:hypothetical protein